MNRLFLSTIVIVCAFYSCKESHKSKATTSPLPFEWKLQSLSEWSADTDYVETKAKIIPDDSLFSYNGIISTEVLDKCKGDFNYLFIDSTKKKSFLELDEKLELKLLSKLIGLNTQWLRVGFYSYLISRQNKIGNLQPLIILSGGTDYSALFLVNVNENGDYVSGTILYGGEDDGSEIRLENDSLVLFRPKIRCLFVNNLIYTNIVNPWVQKYKSEKLDILDSITYLTTINIDGSMARKRIDSTRFYRKLNYELQYSP